MIVWSFSYGGFIIKAEAPAYWIERNVTAPKEFRDIYALLHKLADIEFRAKLPKSK